MLLTCCYILMVLITLHRRCLVISLTATILSNQQGDVSEVSFSVSVAGDVSEFSEIRLGFESLLGLQF